MSTPFSRSLAPVPATPFIHPQGRAQVFRCAVAMSAMDPSGAAAAYAKESNTSLIVGVVATFHAAALVASGLRLYTRGFLVKNVRREDYVLGVSTVSHYCRVVKYLLRLFYRSPSPLLRYFPPTTRTRGRSG